MAMSFNRFIRATGAAFTLMILLTPGIALSQAMNPQVIDIPDIPGYLTLKCDFHMHTVFSDGVVWPTVRVQEAVAEGLDAIAISDHDDYAPHRPDIPVNLVRPHQIAMDAVRSTDLLLIPAIELSRDEPFGHHNALFVTDHGAFTFWDKNITAPQDTLGNHRIAAQQGAFMFWNHPGWKQPDRQGVWTYAQDMIAGNGWLGGIEVVNGRRYDPSAHRFCIEHNLTMMGNSDMHDLFAYSYNVLNGGHRPMTLVFAEERSLEGIREALIARRTAVWWGDTLIGESRFLKPVFEQAVTSSTPRIELAPGGRAIVRLSNSSDIPVILELIPGGSQIDASVEAPQQVTIPAQSSALVQIRRRGGQAAASTGRLAYRVTNFITAPDVGLEATLPVEIALVAAQ